VRILFLILFAAISISPAIGQKSQSFIEVDTATYHAYLDSNWDEIIKLGNQAIDNDIDYYYLRLRLAYAYFMKNKYLMAIPHYKKVLEFSNIDATALEYLFYCYSYTSRENDAEKLVSQFTPSLKSFLKKDNSKFISELSLVSTLGSGADDSLKEEINQTAPSAIEGSQTLLNSYMNFNFSISHRIARSFILHHSVNLLYKDEYVYAVVNAVPYISESQIIRQINYHFAADITPVSGLTLSPVLSYINYRIPIFYTYGVGTGKDREVYRYDTHQEIAFGMKASQHAGIFKISVAGSHSNLNLCEQNTAAISLTALPLGNLNLYITANAYMHFQKQNDSGMQQFFQSVLLGFRPFKHLWIEGYTTIGSFSNLYDPFSELTYNSIEIYTNISNLNIIVPLYKSGISLFAGYRYYKSESMFVQVEDVFETLNHKSFNYQSYTIGIKWKI
jgi:hypothetical protein